MKTDGVKNKNSPLRISGVLQKLRHYCIYQERNHYEVIQKLWDLGVPAAQHDEIIATLIEEDYLNEERFAMEFTGGKFRMNKWGKRKIAHALRRKQVSKYCIDKAMKSIDTEEYNRTAKRIAEDKYASLKSEQYLVRKKKTIDYLIQKGYEPELAADIVNRLVKY
ncbi:MAG: RecX family transcriptional regulator [Chitinophagaceae bacterium]|nr:RecX family transcriptional regulator [Chitinophagaceae bacterium]